MGYIRPCRAIVPCSLLFWLVLLAPAASAITYVSGSVSGEWTPAGNPYVITGRTTINSGSTLTIKPGVIVKFERGMEMAVYGTLRSEGTQEAPVRFTSLRDDSIGGDTNQDGTATIPWPGDWDQIDVSGTAELTWTFIRFGGYSTGGAIYTLGGTVKMNRCVVEDSLSEGVEQSFMGTLEVRNCNVLYNGGSGISCEANSLSTVLVKNSVLAWNGVYGLYNSGDMSPSGGWTCIYGNLSGAAYR